MTVAEPELSVSRPHISDIIRRLMSKAADQDHVTVGHVLDTFGVRGFAFLILILSLLNVVIFMVPLISILFGLPMVILSVQILLGFPAPIFPDFIRNRTIAREPLIKGLEITVYGMEKVERYIKPRLMFLTAPSINRVHGLLALMLAVMVTLPIPALNVPPSLALALLAIGVLQRDGLFILLAYASGVWCLWLFRSLGHFAHSLTQ